MPGGRHQRGDFINNNSSGIDENGNVIKLGLTPKAFNIIWGGSSTNQRCWKCKSEKNIKIQELMGLKLFEGSNKINSGYNNKFQQLMGLCSLRTNSDEHNIEFLELIRVHWLEVSGRIPLTYLSNGIDYKLYFVIKMNPSREGRWDNFPVIFKVSLPGQKPVREEIKLNIYEGKDWQKVPENGLAFKFKKDWSTAQIPELTFAMFEIEYGNAKIGLCLYGVIIDAVQSNDDNV